ncbi:MAG TPA: phosphatase domain-containing protein [Segetibacter sp.]
MKNRKGNLGEENNISFFESFKKNFLHLFKLTNDPVVKVYHGYGSETKMIVFGHVFSLSPLPRKKYAQNFWTNTFALLRSFMVRRVQAAKVRLIWGDTLCEAVTAKDGFFRFEWKTPLAMTPGIYKVQVHYYKEKSGKEEILAKGTGSVIIPFINQYSFISDIDDTFLISHSSNLRKRLYVLLTKNAHSRKPFEGVVNHYKLLASARTTASHPNPFFYVSSSEWNLYDFIKEFTRKNEMPEGVYLLSQIKKLSEVWKTGATKHSTKFMRIARILEAYPLQKFVLLGDDSQQDPVIYAGIVNHFPGRIVSVYLRHVYEKNVGNVRELIKQIEAAGVRCCHFVHSKEAIEHSYKIGLAEVIEEPGLIDIK